MRKVLFALVCLVFSFGLGWFAHRTPQPKPQHDTRTALQRNLFRLGVSERFVYPVEPAGRNVGYQIKTDCTGSLYVSFWSESNEDKEEWVADADGQVLEHRKSSFGGGFPEKRIVSDVTQSVEYAERPSGIAKVNWSVVVLPRQATESGIDGTDLQYRFNKLVEILAQSRDKS